MRTRRAFNLSWLYSDSTLLVHKGAKTAPFCFSMGDMMRGSISAARGHSFSGGSDRFKFHSKVAQEGSERQPASERISLVPSALI